MVTIYSLCCILITFFIISSYTEEIKNESTEPYDRTTTLPINTTTTTSRRTYYHHTRHPEPFSDSRLNYNPTYPQRPIYYPTPYPYPERRHYNSSGAFSHHPNHPTDTTTPPSTHHPRHKYPRYPILISTPTNTREDYQNTITVKTISQPSDIPNNCDTSYDAVTLLRGELFIFKGKYYWRIGANGRYSDYPIEIKRMWPDLPDNFTHVDAVYERPDRSIAIFIGKQLYLFESTRLKAGYPKSLVSLGLPETLEKLDAAMIWGFDGKTYFYSGTNYWKYDEDIGRVDPDYPGDMIVWRGVGYDIDSVFQWKDGKTYFFKGKGFWKFNDLRMTVENEKQLPSAPFWMGCRTQVPG